MTVIKGTIETLQDGALDDLAGRDPLLVSMSRETDRLITLVNDLLVLTRADAGALNLQIVQVDLGKLARSRCKYFEQAAGVRGDTSHRGDTGDRGDKNHRDVRLRVVTDLQLDGQNACIVRADPGRIAQVLDNLLDNAIRYSPPGGEVTVTVSWEDAEVACRVTDRGPGIPAEHLPFIFERFYRANPARGRDEGGSGLGLAIVRGLVKGQGGRTATSSVEGQGTTVTFWFPAAESDL